MTFTADPKRCQPRRAGDTTDWPRPTPRKIRALLPDQPGLVLFCDEDPHSPGAYALPTGGGFLLVGEADVIEGTITLGPATLCSALDDLSIIEVGWIEFSPAGLDYLIGMNEHWEWLPVPYQAGEGPLRDPETGAPVPVADPDAA